MQSMASAVPTLPLCFGVPEHFRSTALSMLKGVCGLPTRSLTPATALRDSWGGLLTGLQTSTASVVPAALLQSQQTRTGSSKRRTSKGSTRATKSAQVELSSALKKLTGAAGQQKPAKLSRPVPESQEDQEEDPEAGSRAKHRPAQVRCFDTARIHVQAGAGGRGSVAFRREANVPRGGPAGGNGGGGGHIWAVADTSLNSLSSFRQSVHFRAKPGAHGTGSNCHGATGTDCIIPVPLGTIVRQDGDEEQGTSLAELLHAGQRALLAQGGRGGRGNASFKTSRNTAPSLAEHGEAGEEAWLSLELKLVADVGIVGIPNAGKSTLLSVLSAAKPKIANYPFTTLVPNLGVCEQDFQSTVFADIPGLLEGAHAGHGLGHEFLRHIQRCRMLVHVLDGTSPDAVGDFRAIQTELELFNPAIADKPQVVAYNKMDVPDASDYWPDMRELLQQEGVDAEDIVSVSAVSGQGVPELVRRVRARLEELPNEDLQASTDALNQSEVSDRRSEDQIDDFEVELEDSGARRWRVHGAAIERFAAMTNWSYYEATVRFQHVLSASGIDTGLRRKGVAEGDTVCIGELEMEWSADRSQTSLYGAWLDSQKGRGRQGSARWPRAAPAEKTAVQE